MSSLVAMFPGQGSQSIGMGRDVLDLFPYTRHTFEEAEDAAKISIRSLCFNGPEDELTLTANTQPCILAISIAMWRVFREECGIEPVGFMGHSLGEYSALVASDKINFSRACYLVRKRGEAMQRAVPEGIGAMAAVMNYSAEGLEKLCENHSTKKSIVAIANYNSPVQLVVAGHKVAVKNLGLKLEAEKIKFVELAVSAPFHSSLMTEARTQMEPLLNETFIDNNSHKIIANLTGKIEENYSATHLIEQIDHPVLWMQSMEESLSLNADSYIEIGPGRVLFGLARRCLPKDKKLIAANDLKQAVESVLMGR